MDTRHFDLAAVIRGENVHTLSGVRMLFISHVSEAVESERLVFLNTSSCTIETYAEDGSYFPDKEESCMDLVSPANEEIASC